MAELFLSLYASGFQQNGMPNGTPKTEHAPVSVGVTAVGILGALTPAYIPGQYSFAIIVGVRGVDYRDPQRIQVQFLDPEGNPVLDTGTTVIPRPDRPSLLTAEHAHVIMGLQAMNVTLSREGTYRTRVIWNDEPLDGSAIPVVRPNDQAPGGITGAQAE